MKRTNERIVLVRIYNIYNICVLKLANLSNTTTEDTNCSKDFLTLCYVRGRLTIANNNKIGLTASSKLVFNLNKS